MERDAYSVLHDVRTGRAMEAAPVVEHLAGVVGMYRRPEEAVLVARLYVCGALGGVHAQAGLVHELRHIVQDHSVALDLELVRAEEEAQRDQEVQRAGYKH